MHTHTLTHPSISARGVNDEGENARVSFRLANADVHPNSQRARAAEELACGRVRLADGEVLDHVQVVAFAGERQVRAGHGLHVRAGSRQSSHGKLHFQAVCTIGGGGPHHPQQ